MTKTIAIYPDNNYGKHGHDEWDSFRSEGRFVINIGFGLSLLGYDVNIIFQGWEKLKKPKKVWDNVYLSREPIMDNYDRAFTFSGTHFLQKAKFDKGIFMGYEPKHVEWARQFIIDTNKQLKFVCPFKYGSENARSMAPFPIYHLPPLFPIPSINIGFLPYIYNPKLPELKVYVHYTSWPITTTVSGERFLQKERLIVNFLKSKYKVKLYVHVESRDVHFPLDINESTINESTINESTINENKEMNYFYNVENNHFDTINLIRSMDICVTVGGTVFNGNCLNDIISLGKPLIYVADGKLNYNTVFTNNLYKCPEYLIYIQESDIDTIVKLKRFISNPKDSYDRFRREYEDQNFDTWKDIAVKIFE